MSIPTQENVALTLFLSINRTILSWRKHPVMHQEYSPEIVLSSEECGLVLMSNVMFSGTKSCLGLPLSGRKFSLQKVISRGLRNTWVGSGEGLGVENNQKIPHTTNIQNPNQLYRCRQLHEETTLNPHRSHLG